MSIKYNINKVHSDLIINFDNVKIEEKSNHKMGNYFEVIASKNKMDVKILISKKNIENENFNWVYYSNPLNENSHLIERTSNINNICEHAIDIINNNRFSKEYIESIKEGWFSKKIKEGDIVITPDGEGVVIPNTQNDGKIWVKLNDESGEIADAN